MKGLIPHHSIAILTSERADIDDARVAKLAYEIIEAQRKGSAEMKWVSEDIGAKGVATREGEGRASSGAWGRHQPMNAG